MAILDTITQEAIADRFFTLPDKFQAALEDAAFLQSVRTICSKYQLVDEEQAYKMEMVAAAVLLGFIHTDELASVLETEVGLTKEIARQAAADMQAQIFAPMRKDLDAVYAPITAPATTSATQAPIAPPAPVSMPVAPAPMPTAVSGNAAPAKTVAPVGSGIPAGISIANSIPSKFTIPTNTPAPAVEKVAAAPAAAPATPAPFILHQESSAAPLASAGSSFKLSVSSDIFKSSAASKSIDIPRPPKAAELEIGRAPFPPKKPGGPITTAPANRIVHYTDFRTTIAPGFGEMRPATPAMTAPPAPKPPQAPLPPAIPKPAAPTQIPTTPTTPVAGAAPKPKVVNFGPEAVK